MEGITGTIDKYGQMLLDYSPRLLLAILLFVVGFYIVGKLEKVIENTLNRTNLGAEIKPLLRSFITILLKVIVIIVVASVVGIKTASFMTLVAALSLAIGMGLQDSLSNVASGLLLLIFKPYKVGDFISLNDQEGFVKEIQLINTIILNLQNEHVIIPNSSAIGEVIVNSHGSDGYKRLEFTIHMPYEESFDRVQTIILDALSNIDEVLKDPEPLVGIDSFDTHTIIIAVKPYATIENYEKAFFNSTAAVKKALGEQGIKMCYSEGIELGAIGV